MKPALLLLFFSIIAILAVVLTYKPDKCKTVIQMDGLLHWYRVENYEVDKNNCIHFYDGMRERIRYCGSYRIVSMDEFSKHEKGR